MELKPYQQQVINDLSLFLEKIQAMKQTDLAFTNFWATHPKTPLQPFPGNAIEPYKNNIPRVPHVCIKVPTAGGKTFIACNALKPVFDHFDRDRPKAVVWLVPSITILEQTITNLKNPAHPYRQKINAHFGHKVAVFDKNELLQGAGFNASTIYEQLSIMVFSFDSLRAKNKDDRKVFQENGNLQSFENLLGKENELTLGSVIKFLNPVVVVDESHNAESDLSIDMLKEINPCFILDLTATPRKNSNIISFIDALELKKENMVKLPIIVYNHEDKNEVISSALQLQKRLEDEAIAEEEKGGKYIRPIVLFQAQPRNAEDNTTFEKLKEKLIQLKIPAEQIRIKTASLNEIRNEDLMSRNCQVRFIITVNALKEGWDCPFAYILASLADKSSAVDVEQILGRVLRQPYVIKHEFQMLNMSYVLTASAKFMDTLHNIVKGLNKAGFSDKDYKLAEPAVLESAKQVIPKQLSIPSTIAGNDEIHNDIDPGKILELSKVDTSSAPIFNIEKVAREQHDLFEKTVSDMEKKAISSIPDDIQKQVKHFSIKETFAEQASQLRLPQFFIKIPANDLFNQSETDVLLEKEALLENFPLSKSGTDIDFGSVSSELYQIDLDETRKEHTPTFIKLDNHHKGRLMTYILDPSRKESRVKNMTHRLMDVIGNIYPIPDTEIDKYIRLVLEGFTDEQFNDLVNNEYSYSDKIRREIKKLSERFAEKTFKIFLDTDKAIMKPSFAFPGSIAPGETAKDMTKTLYEKEGKMNGFEETVINQVANFDNIAFWTRNIEKKGFRINGFINHYPDFIIHAKSGKTIVLETKGDHLDAEQKITLGNYWAGKAGNDFRYFMVYENRVVDGAYKLADFLNTIKNI